MNEQQIAKLIACARAHGTEVQIHDESVPEILVVPDQRAIFVSRHVSPIKRFRLLCEAMLQLGLSHVLLGTPPPLVGSSTSLPLQLRDSSDTVEASPPRAAEHEADEPRAPSVPGPPGDPSNPPASRLPFAGVLGCPRCELCSARSYAVVLGVTMCRHHLVQLVGGKLDPVEVRLLRQRHGSHPDLSFERYDGFGRTREHRSAFRHAEAAR